MQCTPAPLSILLPRQSSLFDTCLPDPQLHVSVVIPARNEANHLEQALNALRNQRQRNGASVPASTYEVLLLLNNCTDHSVAVAQAYQQRYPDFPLYVAIVHLPTDKANVGTARRMLMDAACWRLRQVGRPNGIIASTDADTMVDAYWIDQIRAEIERGCEVVGGRILTCPDGRLVRLNHLRDVTYRMLIAQLEACLDPQPADPWPRHFQHFGASLALTCAAYERVGGLPNVPHLEDEALYRALLRTDTPIRKSPQVRVTTSTRTLGQVDVGFSEQLRYWEALNETSQSQLVEAPQAIYQRLLNRHRLRTIWQKRHAGQPADALTRIATDLLVEADWLGYQLNQATYFGQLWEDIENRQATGSWASYWQPVPVKTAISELRLLVHSLATV